MNRDTMKRHAEERKAGPKAETKPSGITAAAQSSASGSAAVPNTDYQINDTIEHKKWGHGVVVGVSGSGEDLSIRVIFPEMGMKDLFVKYAPIKKVEQ